MSSEAWEDLVTTAVLGTERRRVAVPTSEGGLGLALRHIDSSLGAEQAILSAAAMFTAFQQAGRLPEGRVASAPSLAPSELRQQCSARAAQHLQAMLGGSQRDILSEWLMLLDNAGLCVPVSRLPELLEAGRAQAHLRPLVRAVVGARGHWLASQNRDWEYAALDQTERSQSWETLTQIWEISSRPVRVALLETLRMDRPEQARNLIATTWATEKADDRAAFLGMLAHGLSMADEPFLETALDDRSKEVRTIAVDLLLRLPESRLVQRMITRVSPLLGWVAAAPSRLLGLQKGRPSTIEVTLPEQCDKTMVRDGVDAKPVMQHQKLGERAQWLLQMLRTIPPQHWCTEWHTTPTELLDAANRNEWKSVLEAAWISAIQNNSDSAWAEALLQSDPTITSLFPVLPTERQEAFLLGLLHDLHGPLTQSAALALLQQTTHLWSAELTRAVLRAVHKHMISHQNQRDYQLLNAFDTFARRIPPVLVHEVASGWPAEQPTREHWQGAIDRLLITLHFRHDMAEAIIKEQP